MILELSMKKHLTKYKMNIFIYKCRGFEKKKIIIII